MKCNVCKAELTFQGKFCTNCGAPYTTATSQLYDSNIYSSFPDSNARINLELWYQRKSLLTFLTIALICNFAVNIPYLGVGVIIPAIAVTVLSQGHTIAYLQKIKDYNLPLYTRQITKIRCVRIIYLMYWAIAFIAFLILGGILCFIPVTKQVVDAMVFWYGVPFLILYLIVHSGALVVWMQVRNCLITFIPTIQR